MGGGGTPPGQDRTGIPPRPVQGYPLARTGTGLGVPQPGHEWGTLPPSETEQQSEYLLRSGRYASCGHAGGLSCFLISFKVTMNLRETVVVLLNFSIHFFGFFVRNCGAFVCIASKFFSIHVHCWKLLHATYIHPLVMEPSIHSYLTKRIITSFFYQLHIVIISSDSQDLFTKTTSHLG